MKMKEICPCVNLNCRYHGDCENCTSRHLRKNSINYCGFYTILPELQEAIKASPDSPTAQKLSSMIETKVGRYDKLIARHGLNIKRQEELLKKVADFNNQ